MAHICQVVVAISVNSIQCTECQRKLMEETLRLIKRCIFEHKGDIEIGDEK